MIDQYRYLDVRNFSANAQQKTVTIGAPNVDGAFRIDSICLRITGTTTGAGTTLGAAWTDESGRDEFYDALISKISLDSGPLGQVIDPMSLSELIRAARNLTGRDAQSNFPLPGETVTMSATGVFPFELNVEIPQSLINANDAMRTAFATCAAFWRTGGLNITFGDGSIASGNFVATSATQVEVLIRGRQLDRVIKATPVRFRKTVTSDATANFEPGLMLGLNWTGNAGAQAFTVAACEAISNDVNLSIDGVRVIEQQTFRPALIQNAQIASLLDPGDIQQLVDKTNDDGADDRSLFGVPLVYTGGRSGPGGFTVVRDTAHLSLNTAFTGVKTFLWVQVQPTSKIENAGLCPCGSDEMMVVQTPPAFGGRTPANLAPFLPMAPVKAA